MKWLLVLTRNIAKSGEVQVWNFSPFQIFSGLIKYHSQSASGHISTVVFHYDKPITNDKILSKNSPKNAD